MKILGISFGSHTGTKVELPPPTPLSENAFYTGNLEDVTSLIPNLDYQLIEQELEVGDKKKTVLLCTDKKVEERAVLDTSKLDSREKLTEEIKLSKKWDEGATEVIKRILGELSNSRTSKDRDSNSSLTTLNTSYGFGFVDIHDPKCFSSCDGNRYLFLKLPLKGSSGTLIPIARTRNWKGEPVYINPEVRLGTHSGKEYVILKYKGFYIALDHSANVRIATNVIEPDPPPVRHHKGWFAIFED